MRYDCHAFSGSLCSWRNIGGFNIDGFNIGGVTGNPPINISGYTVGSENIPFNL